MNNHTLYSLFFLGASLGSAGPIAADTFDFHFSAEAEHDSSVGISELDEFTREADSAWITTAGVKGRWQTAERFSLAAHYEFTHHNYSEQNAYDQNLHHFSLNPQLQFGKLKVGVRHDSVLAELAGDDFMDYRQNAFAVEGSLSSAFYLRVAYNLADKQLADFAERDADTAAWSGDLFWFSETGEHFVVLSRKLSEEDARDDLYDFSGTQWKLAYTRKFYISQHASKLKLSHSLDTRRYSWVELPETTARNDNKRVNEISFESELNDSLALIASLEFVDNHSTLASVNYEEEVTTIGLRCIF